MTDSNVIPFRPVPVFMGDKPTAPHKSAEYMQQVAGIRMRKRAERISRGENPSGKGRLKPITDKEIREKALESAADLFDDSRTKAVNKLVAQIDHKDPGIAQKAAIKVLEYTDGKPNQPVTARTENITKVVYETAAIPADGFVPGFGLDETVDEA